MNGGEQPCQIQGDSWGRIHLEYTPVLGTYIIAPFASLKRSSTPYFGHLDDREAERGIGRTEATDELPWPAFQVAAR